MFETSQECILDIIKPLQPSKNLICSNFGFFRVFHTPDLAVFGSFLAYKFQNPFRKWPKSDENMKKI